MLVLNVFICYEAIIYSPARGGKVILNPVDRGNIVSGNKLEVVPSPCVERVSQCRAWTVVRKVLYVVFESSSMTEAFNNTYFTG